MPEDVIPGSVRDRAALATCHPGLDPGSTRLVSEQVRIQIPPLRIATLDQRDLPFALPVLDLLLPADGSLHRTGRFEPDEALHPVRLGESIRPAFVVLVDTFHQVAGDA